MDQPSPLDALRTLLGATVTAVRRLAVASEHGIIPLTSTLALDLDQRFIVLSYSQQGLRCLPPASEHELQWDKEIEDGERLILSALEADAVLPELPCHVDHIVGWVGYGRYSDVFAVAFGTTNRLVITTTSDDLLCTTLHAARGSAEAAARNSGLTLRHEVLTGS